MPELMRPGVTGFLVDGADGGRRRRPALGAIDRPDCRADARERFSADRMVADYERLFQSIAGQ